MNNHSSCHGTSAAFWAAFISFAMMSRAVITAAAIQSDPKDDERLSFIAVITDGFILMPSLKYLRE
jgi:hypothetical protein